MFAFLMDLKWLDFNKDFLKPVSENGPGGDVGILKIESLKVGSVLHVQHPGLLTLAH